MTAMRDLKAIKEFILAGNALFTIKSRRTGERFTFKVRGVQPQAEQPPTHWNVAVLYGPDNTRHYKHFGRIIDEDFVASGGIKTKAESVFITAFDWFWTKLRLGSDPLARCEFFHAGRCGRCGRLLTTPESVSAGIGPECRDKMDFEAAGGASQLLASLFGDQGDSDDE